MDAYSVVMPPRKAKLEPKYIGVLNPVINKYNIVPTPEHKNATWSGITSNPALWLTKIGTKILAPNIANTCWKVKSKNLKGDLGNWCMPIFMLEELLFTTFFISSMLSHSW